VSGAREDRRVRRTRRLLREALLELILEKGYDRLTVQDVLDRADVGRATFYAHFHDKDDLLVSGAEDLRESLRQKMAGFLAGRGEAESDDFDVTRVLFEHAAAHRRLYRALVGKRVGGVIHKHAQQDLSALFREHLEEAVAARQLTPALPVEVVVQYVVSGLLALLTWWLDNDLPYTAEEMNHMFQRLTHNAVAGVMEVRPTNPVDPEDTHGGNDNEISGRASLSYAARQSSA
jgi:AcrR family transcriptional regulator